MPNHKLPENVYLAKIHLVVRQIMISQTNLTVLIYNDNKFYKTSVNKHTNIKPLVGLAFKYPMETVCTTTRYSIKKHYICIKSQILF
jgi:hypothetical protein